MFYIRSINDDTIRNRLKIEIILPEYQKDTILSEGIIHITEYGTIYRGKSVNELINVLLEKDGFERLRKDNCKFSNNINENGIKYFLDMFTK